jgi:hypothetical protein
MRSSHSSSSAVHSWLVRLRPILVSMATGQ